MNQNKTRVKTTILITTFLLFASVGFAQKTDTAAVLTPIQQLFEGLAAKDSTLLQQPFLPEATLATTYTDSLGKHHLQQQEVALFISSISNLPKTVQLEEKILNYQLQVDVPLATVWTPYEFYLNGNLSHCGVNAFTLFLSDKGWKIISIIDTRRRDDCQD